jgi:hypothetical protein
MDVTEHELLTQELRRQEPYLAEAQILSHTASFGWKPGCEKHVVGQNLPHLRIRSGGEGHA